MRPLSDLFGRDRVLDRAARSARVALLVTLPAALGLTALFPERADRPGLVGPVVRRRDASLALGGALGTDVIVRGPRPRSSSALGLLLARGHDRGPCTPCALGVGPIAALPGAVVLAGANHGLAAGWVPVLIVVGTLVIGATAADLDRRTARCGLGPLLLFVAVGRDLLHGAGHRAHARGRRRRAPARAPRLAVRGGVARRRRRVRRGRDPAVDRADRRHRPAGRDRRRGRRVRAADRRAARACARSRARGAGCGLHRFPLRLPASPYVVAAQVVLVLYATRVAGRAQSAVDARCCLLIPAVVAAVAFGVFFVIPERRAVGTADERRDALVGQPGPSATSNGHGNRGNGHGPPSAPG